MGETLPPLETLWLDYLRHFALEHWYRFAKQRLYWTHPQFTSPLATQRWSELMPLITWQLWLARAGCVDHSLLWQSPQDSLSPGRAAQAFASILVAIGTPAPPPKPRGKSPGRATGYQPPARPRYPTVKKDPPNAKSQSNLLARLTQQRLRLETGGLQSTEFNCHEWLSKFFISSRRASLKTFSPN